MRVKPTVNFSGKLGFEFNRVWDAIMRLRPQETPNQLTQYTSKGTNILPTAKGRGGTGSSGKAIWL